MRSVIVTSRDGSTSAAFVPEANLLCCSLRYEGAELLDQRQGAEAYRERGKTMGIPLLYPWANRLETHRYRIAGKAVDLPKDDPRIPVDPGGLPIHGVLPGLLRWEVEDADAGDKLTARLRWASSELLELFPCRHELLVEAAVAAGRLTIATTVIATGDDAVPVSFGYHPYLCLPGSSRQSWRVSLGASERLVLDDNMIPTGERQPLEQRAFGLADTSWDDSFDGLDSPARFEVAGKQLRLTMTFLEGYGFAQVYAPPAEDFICFEPMTAPTNALISGDGLQTVAQGERYRAAFEVVVSQPDDGAADEP